MLFAEKMIEMMKVQMIISFHFCVFKSDDILKHSDSSTVRKNVFNATIYFDYSFINNAITDSITMCYFR